MIVTSSPSRRMAASPKRHRAAVVGHLAALAVERLVLDEDDGVVVADRRLEQPLGVGRRSSAPPPAGRARAGRTPRSSASAWGRAGGPRRPASGSPSAPSPGRRTCSGSTRAWLTIWSIASSEKLTVISSTTGRSPSIAAPTPMPTMVFSEIGVSRTRFSPNSSSRPCGHLEGALEDADVLAHDEDLLVGLASPRAAPG